jgi:ABC-2 type transport system permease protein
MYWSVAVKSFQRHLAYRAANLAGIVTNMFFGAIYVFVYTALFQNHTEVGGLDLQDTITYAVLSQSLLMVMSAFGNRELSLAIVKGDIVTDLSRPVDFYLFWGAVDAGRAVYYLVFRGLPTFALGWILFHPRPPASAVAGALFLATLVLGILVSFAFRFITNSLAFWTTDARGINYLTNTVILFFSGFIVPLNFFPGPLRTLAEWLPFRALVNLPVNVYLGMVTGGALWLSVAQLGVWLLLLVLAGRLLLGRMVRRLSVQGG